MSFGRVLRASGPIPIGGAVPFGEAGVGVWGIDMVLGIDVSGIDIVFSGFTLILPFILSFMSTLILHLIPLTLHRLRGLPPACANDDFHPERGDASVLFQFIRIDETCSRGESSSEILRFHLPARSMTASRQYWKETTGWPVVVGNVSGGILILFEMVAV